MKLRMLVLIALLFVTAVAAEAEPGDISLGAKMGLTQTNISQTPESWDDATSYRAGFTAGMFLNYEFNDNFSLQPELLYVQKGVDATLYEGFIDIGATLSLEYFELPLLAKYRFAGMKKVTPYIYGGPSFSYALSSELKGTVSILSAEVDFSSLTHTTDFGIIMGGGIEVPAGSVTLLFDGRFMYGFTNVILTGDFEFHGYVQSIEEDDFKNFGFVFTAGLGFDI